MSTDELTEVFPRVEMYGCISDIKSLKINDKKEMPHILIVCQSSINSQLTSDITISPRIQDKDSLGIKETKSVWFSSVVYSPNLATSLRETRHR